MSEPTASFRTAIYCRLSVLDNGKEFGDSIDNQTELLESYVRGRPELILTDRFIDNGHTGTDFDRPEWERLMASIKRGAIDCVVVKDLSRLGRNYIEAGQLLEKVFPFLGIRFISVNDGYDSASLTGSEELSASLKNIINDYYAKDISQKSGTALRIKRRRGDYIGSYAPYGYLKDPGNKNHLIIDPRTAPIVKQIFQWRAEGMGYGSILQTLNSRDIPSPGRYRFENGIVTNNNKQGSSLLWGRHVLTDMLDNIVYIGHLAQGKGSSCLYANIPFHRTGKDEWDIVYNTHEPIIDDELFRQVQAVNEAHRRAYSDNYGKYSNLSKARSPYGSRLVCADCGSVLKLYRCIAKGGKKAYFVYVCPRYEELKELGCPSKKSIRSADLDEAVLSALKGQFSLFLDAGAVLEKLLANGELRDKSSAENTLLSDLRRQLKRKQSLFTATYTDYHDGLLDKEEFSLAREKYRTDIERLEQQISGQKASTHKYEKLRSDTKKWKALIKSCCDSGDITREMVSALISKISVGGEGQLTISFAFEDDLAAVNAVQVKESEGAA